MEVNDEKITKTDSDEVKKITSEAPLKKASEKKIIEKKSAIS